MKSPIVALLLCSMWVSALYGETLQGKVVGVSDGDTITVLDSSKTQHKIRLAGIDAPEKAQAFGERSKQHLSDLVFGKTVTVDWNKTDRYGRTIGKVVVNGQDANLRQVQAGLAWHYKQYEKEQSASDRSSYAQAEVDARTRRIGLWRDAAQIPPWDFRHRTVDSPSTPLQATSENCSCDSNSNCTGPRGGRYCMTSGGKKRYL
jgi:endonuclease YncB( thermonuclease family)